MPNFNASNKLRYNTIQHLLNTVCFLRYTHDSQKINLLSLNNYHGGRYANYKTIDGKILKICTTYLYELLRTDSKVEYITSGNHSQEVLNHKCLLHMLYTYVKSSQSKS